MAGGKSEKADPSFLDFIELRVLPRRRKHPDHERLDGKKKGANRKAFGSFVRRGRVWSVAGDTHYEPLLLAYMSTLESTDAFVERELARGRRLDLNDDLLARLGRPANPHFNVYGR